MEVSSQRVRVAGCCTPTGNGCFGHSGNGDVNHSPLSFTPLARGEETGAGMIMQEKREWA